MARFTQAEIRIRFSTLNDFNELLEVFQDALDQKIDDIELYRLLFWNSALSPDELCLFGKKLAREFPALAYDVFMWLANVFEVTYSSYDNFELAIEYYQKAAAAKPEALEPYINAVDCYEPDLNIPPVDVLIAFVKAGIDTAVKKKPLYQRLAQLYEFRGDTNLSAYYRTRSEEFDESVQ